MTRASRIPALAASLLLAITAVSGCVSKVSVAQAERSCMHDAGAARGPQAKVSMGVLSSGGRVRPHAGMEVSVTSDAIMGRDPAEVYTSCVMRRSGQMPTRALYDHPGFRG